MIYAIPFIGWIIGLALAVSTAVPFYFLWNWLAPIYFYWLPKVYLHIPFWNVVGLFVILSILKSVLFPNAITTSRK